MEFGAKLQQLRKGKEWTQEQLAEALFVSRTAVSKWESGKGYPNIDSFKSISKLFGVSIDALLSGEELMVLAAKENQTNMQGVFTLIYGVLDLMMLSFLFLPLFGQQDGDVVHMVNLFALSDVFLTTRIVYFCLPILMAGVGAVAWFAQRFMGEKSQNIIKTLSIVLQAGAIFVFINTRQVYATSLAFMFFLVKIALMMKSRRIK